jgi:hypothetical protein
MAAPDNPGTGSDTDKPAPDEIQADIEETRAELGETIEALTAKLDVKTRAKHKLDGTKDQVMAQLVEVKGKAVDLSVRAKAGATDEAGRPTPEAMVVAVAAGAVVAALVSVVVWRRR